jgi:ABC-type phosphate transport system substrate-binding protein
MVRAKQSSIAFLFVVLAAAPALAHHMAVVMAKESTVSNLSSAELSKIFRAEVRKWPDGKPITLVLHRASPGEAVTLEHLNRMSAAEWLAWMAQHKQAIKLVASDEDVLSYVKSMPGAIGLVDVRSVNSQVNLIRIDGKLPMEDGYLSH